MNTFLPSNYSLPSKPKPERLWICKKCSQGEQPFQLAGISQRCELCAKDYAFGKFEKTLGSWKVLHPDNDTEMKIINGDCLEVMKAMPDNSFDSIITDPPYELGFMGKAWDSTGIANSKEMWAECLRVLKPGGYLLSFGGTRTYHRMAVAIEDAGFEIRDMIEWVYGSGFPKSLNIGKAVDKLQGNEREDLGRTQQ
jgi:hypothetical protein